MIWTLLRGERMSQELLGQLLAALIRAWRTLGVYDKALDGIAQAVAEVIPGVAAEPEIGQVLMDLGNRLKAKAEVARS